MWSHQGDHPAVNRALRVEAFKVDSRRRIPKPDFYLSAAPAPYPSYHELNDPYLESYYARPNMRKVLLEHGIIHPKDYEVIFGPSKSGKAQSTQETLRKITLLTRAERREVAPERALLPYLPDAMRRLVRAGTKMNEASMQGAKAEIMSRPLDYIVIRLEEQLRAVKNAAYEAKQPTVMKNMKNLGFKDIYYKNIDINNEEDMKKVAVLRRQQSAFRHWEDRYHTHHAKKLEKTRAERMLDLEHHHTEAPDTAHYDKERAHSTAGSRLRMKLNKERALADCSRRRRQESRPAVKGTRKETLAIEYRQKEEEKRRASQQRSRSRRRPSTGRPRPHRCKFEDPFEQNIHRKAAKRLAAEAQHRKKQQGAERAHSVSPVANSEPSTAKAPSTTRSATVPAGKSSARLLDSSRSRQKSDVHSEVKDADDKNFQDKDFRLPKSPSGTWPWKELQIEKEKAELERPDKTVEPETYNPLLKVSSDGDMRFDTASEDVDIGTSEPGILHTSPPIRQHPALDHKEHLTSDVTDHLAAGFLRSGEEGPPQSISFYDFGPKRVHAVESAELNPDRATVSSPLDYSRSAQYEAYESSQIPPERDPLPKKPSGSWPWQQMQKEQAKQTSTTTVEELPNTMMLHRNEDGADYVDTRSSIVDVNEPEFEDDAAFIVESTLSAAQDAYNDHPKGQRSAELSGIDKRTPSAVFDAEKPKEMELEELKRQSHHDMNFNNHETRHRPKSAELQKMVAAHEKWSTVKIPGIENAHALEPLKESDHEIPVPSIPIPGKKSVISSSLEQSSVPPATSTHLSKMPVPVSSSDIPPVITDETMSVTDAPSLENETDEDLPDGAYLEDPNGVARTVTKEGFTSSPEITTTRLHQVADTGHNAVQGEALSIRSNIGPPSRPVSATSINDREDDISKHAADITKDIVVHAEGFGLAEESEAHDDTATNMNASAIVQDVVRYAETIPSAVNLTISSSNS
ncbi:uncharacterized protein LOC129585651 isoform X2 [Paramacrobiotus metropolitanus]|uniref:uncharacterized protein LOC129585651 isoform X2 n=1 Tax=Paramacrobiotus metropolitanus TaxID=2943436 RepID=UPI002445672E|nr:uncharacterized protein LOC129585651 isoform X2 [Paramacrobiotus metropolitanus]